MIVRGLKIGIILLSRYNSSRLPGKALMKINGKPLLSGIIERLSTIYDREDIIIATSNEETDNPITQWAEIEGLSLYRGNLINVASRFLCAANFYQLDYAIRVTGDSLFIDPHIIDELASYIEDSDYDLISNRKFKMYPIGQTIEIINIKTMDRDINSFSTPEDFEHVTEFFYRKEEELSFRIRHHKNNEGSFRDISLAIDTPYDFQIANHVAGLLGDSFDKATYVDIYNLYKKTQEDML